MPQAANKESACEKCGKKGHVGKDCRMHLTCESCGKKAHSKAECRSKGGEKYIGTISSVEPGKEKWVMGIAHPRPLACDNMPDGFNVGGIMDARGFTWVSIDSGSDADGCPPDFGYPSQNIANAGSARLHTATNGPIEDYGERQVYFSFSMKLAKSWYRQTSLELVTLTRWFSLRASG